MAVKEQIDLMSAYGLWADQQLCERIDLLSSEKLDQAMKSSFPTIRLTIAHIYDAYRIWMDRLNGGSMNYWPSRKIENFNTKYLIEESMRLKEFVHSLNEQDLNKICTYSNLKGKAFHTPFYGVLLHAINHGTYHRGQLVSMLRNLGEDDIPQTDLIAYLRL